MSNYQFIIISVDPNRLNKTMNILNEINKNNKNIITINGFAPDNSQDYFVDSPESYKQNDKYNKILMCVVRSHMKAIEIASLDTSSEFSIILEDDITVVRDNFIDIIEELISNWDDISSTHTDKNNSSVELMHIGWLLFYTQPRTGLAVDYII